MNARGPLLGEVSKRSVPMRLTSDIPFSFGFKIGRRSAALMLVDLNGELRNERQLAYLVPMLVGILTSLSMV